MSKLLFLIAKVTLTAFIGWLMLLNCQPWLKFAEYTAPLMTKVPFLEALVRIPFLGGWIEFLASNAVAVAGIVAWGVIQFLQILPMAYDRETIYSSLIKNWQGRQFNTDTEKNEGLRKLKEAYNSLATEDVEALNKYRMWAYIAELIATLWLYMPYQEGFTGLVDDFPALDVDSILWGNVLMIPITMFGFEILFKVVLRIWRLSSKAKLHTA
jgi:hypothetical protein